MKHRSFLLLATLAPFVLAIACSSSSTPSGEEVVDGGPGGTDAGGGASSSSSSSSSGSSGGSSSGASSGGSSSSSSSGSSSGSSAYTDAGSILSMPGFVVASTSDGMILYGVGTLSELTVVAVPFAGGNASFVLNDAPNSYLGWALSGRVVVTQSESGGVYAWSSTSGGLVRLTSNSALQYYPANPSGTQVLYGGPNFNFDAGTIESIWSVGEMDGGGRKILDVTTPTADSAGNPQWAGNSVVISHPVPGDAGAYDMTLGLLTDPTSASPIKDLQQGTSFSVSPDGTTIYVPSGTGPALTYASATGAAGAPIDTTAQEAFFVGSSSDEIIYRSGAALKRSATVSPSPSTLVASGVSTLLGVSPNGATAAYLDSASNVWITSTASSDAGSGVQILPAGGIVGVNSAPYDGLFTRDSSYLLYMSTWSADVSGTLVAVPVNATGSSQAITLGTRVAYREAAAGAKVVYCANSPPTAPSCDVTVIDLAATTPTPKVLATGVDLFAVSPDGTQVAYGTTSGLQIVNL